jgi:long-subunit fatty acid transport protein
MVAALTSVFAGNPDRQGQAGASQLLINPWARSAGLHALTVATATGVEAVHINPAAGVRISSTELALSHTRYFSGSDINISAFGFSRKVGKSGALTVGIMSINVGEMEVTTEALGGSTGATFSPNIFNMGIGYSHAFGEKIAVGVMFHGVSEGTSQVSAFGFSIDAGVQYKANRFKFGLALRNIGGPAKFSGQGLSFPTPNRDGNFTFSNTVESRAQKFELPSTLSIGSAYEIPLGAKNSLSVIGQFTSNSFSRDNIGGGAEFKFADLFTLRGGYRYEVGVNSTTVDRPVATGVCAGFSAQVPLRKGNKDTGLGIDYGYQATNLWKGNHSIALRIAL